MALPAEAVLVVVAVVAVAVEEWETAAGLAQYLHLCEVSGQCEK